MSYLESSVDIGTCVNKTKGGLNRIYCLNDATHNYCCRLATPFSLDYDPGQRACCSHEEYSDQHWVLMATIQGFTILLTIMFLHLIVALIWFHYIVYKTREEDVQESRQRIIRHLLKRQLLHKSQRSPPTVLGSLRNIKASLSSSRSKKRTQKQKQGQRQGKKASGKGTGTGKGKENQKER